LLKISIIVPIFNIESYVEKCVDSIVNQTYKNIEIILINDGSTDNSGKICDRLKKDDLRIKVIHTKNSGLSAARNNGLKIATGEYIMFLDGDDFITLNAVNDIQKIIKSKKSTDIIIGKFINYYDEKRQEVESFNFDETNFKNKEGSEVLSHILNDYPVNMWSACRSIYNRKLFTDNNLTFKQGITSEDLFLVPDLYLCAKAVMPYNTPFYYYRRSRPNTITSSLNAKLFHDMAYVINSYLVKIQSGEYNRKVRKALLGQLADLFVCYITLLNKSPKEERKDIIANMKKSKRILIHTRLPMYRIIAIFTMIFGFNAAARFYQIIKKQ